MKKFLLLSLLLCSGLLHAADVVEHTLPVRVKDVKTPVLCLNGKWRMQYSAQSEWAEVRVPGELAMQGYAIRHDSPVMYEKTVKVPAAYEGKRIILRFDGVYSDARLWVNGKHIIDHSGGFTRWESDVTDIVVPGKKNVIRLEVTDRLYDVSYASGYAHHPIGGILRDVTLYVLPEAHLQNFYTETILDDDYEHAQLRAVYTLTGDAEVAFRLYDPQGKEVSLPQPSQQRHSGTQIQEFPVSAPSLWDAEHPRLYTLWVKVGNGEGEYSFSRQIGFRRIEVKGDRMFVNGQQVKLRGACRHDIHPTLGRVSTYETDSLDAVLFKRSNMNFVRTSHYPPTERFLTFCDRMGIYVESETALCFVDTYRQQNYGAGNTQDNDSLTARYMSQLQEMVATSRSHASVLFWSIGNESVYGRNFQLSYDWLKANDTTRPVIFSYPGGVPADRKAYDLLSMHYPPCDGNMTQWDRTTKGFQGEGIPALFDEWAHVPCYTYTTLQDDPNIREFWGISLDKMWSTLFDAPGGLGGAIWCYSDETFMLPVPKVGEPFWIEFAHTAKPEGYRGNCVGYGEWGIVDVWRREKPEFWSTKKAYSPIRVEERQVDAFTAGRPLALKVYNRFDHTNLDEVEAVMTYQGVQTRVPMPGVLPHEHGHIQLPAQAWREGDNLLLEFFDEQGNLIDAEQITLGKQVAMPEVLPLAEALVVDDKEEQVVVRGETFAIPFNKHTGLMEQVTSHGKVVVEKGPFLNLDLNVSHKTGAEVREKAQNYIVADSNWVKDYFTCKQNGENVEVHLTGHYCEIGMDMLMRIAPDGTITIDYHTENEPNGWLREAGLKFYLSDRFQQLSWKRKGYWSYYPTDHFAGNEGSVGLYDSRNVAYGENPKQPWNNDTHNYYYFADKGAASSRPLTHKAQGMKEHIVDYTLRGKWGKAQLSVRSAGTDACRINRLANEQLVLYVNNRWDYPEIAWGDYCKAIDVVPVKGTITLHL